MVLQSLTSGSAGADPLSHYEQERLARIEANRKRMGEAPAARSGGRAGADRNRARATAASRRQPALQLCPAAPRSAPSPASPAPPLTHTEELGVLESARSLVQTINALKPQRPAPSARKPRVSVRSNSDGGARARPLPPLQQLP